MKQFHYSHHAWLIPEYSDETYTEFMWWEIYPCDCSTKPTELCDCAYESEPRERADTLAEAQRIAAKLWREGAGVRFLERLAR